MIYTIQNDFLRVSVDSLGAELHSITGKNGEEYLCPSERLNWEGHAPILFPNTGAVKDSISIIGGNIYPYVQHGFAKKARFSLVSCDSESVKMQLCWTKESLQKYPGQFVLCVEYLLDRDKLFVISEVTNEGQEALYYSMGFHPGFSCPLISDERAVDYIFLFEDSMSASRLVLENGLVSGKTELYWNKLKEIPVTERMFDGGSFTMVDLTSRTVRMQSKVSEKFVELWLGDYPNLVLWAPKYQPITNICMEPWYGIPDLINTDHCVEGKPFTIQLQPGQQKELKFSLRFG